MDDDAILAALQSGGSIMLTSEISVSSIISIADTTKGASPEQLTCYLAIDNTLYQPETDL
ncbi:MAG: hypothetical protein IKN17_07335 [Ruminococcus sp.]|nr:hypothetical protein [Ruminococcus sp.]